MRGLSGANSDPILRCQPEIGNDNDDLFEQHNMDEDGFDPDNDKVLVKSTFMIQPADCPFKSLVNLSDNGTGTPDITKQPMV